MDVNEITDYFQQQPLETVSFDQRMEETTSSTFPTLSESELEAILNSLFPSENIIKSPIESEPGYIDVNSDLDINPFEAFKDASSECENLVGCGNLSQNYQCNDFTGESVLDNLDQILTPTFTNNPNSSFSSDASLSTESHFTSFHSQNTTQSSNEPYIGTKEIDKLPSQLRQPYSGHQSKILTPADPGFKPVLTVCTDSSTVKEPWNPNVTKKILAAYYTPLSLKSEFLATQTALDEFQSLALKEAVSAFHDVAFDNTIVYKIGRYNSDSCPQILVGTCKKLRAFRRLQFHDKVTLLSNVFFDVVAMKGVLTYDNLTDTWNSSGARVNRRDVYRLDASFHDDIVHIIETFPDRWRRNLTVAALLYLIMIFNPDLPNLKFEESIRLEQYTYIYLLQRYLESICELPCDAQDYLYRLMVKIEEIQKLRQKIRQIFEMFILNDSLSNCISRLVQ